MGLWIDLACENGQSVLVIFQVGLEVIRVFKLLEEVSHESSLACADFSLNDGDVGLLLLLFEVINDLLGHLREQVVKADRPSELIDVLLSL